MNFVVKTRMAAILLALGVCLGAAAQQKEVRVYREGNNWVEETTGSTAAARGLSLQSAVGSVQVRGASQANVTYTIKKKISRSAEDAAKHDMENFVVSVARHGESVLIEADWPRQRSGRLNAEFYVTVPKETAIVKVATLGGNVSVEGIAGKTYAQTAGGSVTLDEIGGSAEGHTMGGSV